MMLQRRDLLSEYVGERRRAKPAAAAGVSAAQRFRPSDSVAQSHLGVRSLLDMERRTLGPFEISPVGVGTAPLGSTVDWAIWWGRQDEREAIGAIHRALDLGVNWIDTAPFYGWGRAEEIVGSSLSGRRDDVLLFTKCGTFPDGDNLRPESIRRDLEASLRRLQTDQVDLLQFHDPDPTTPIEE